MPKSKIQPSPATKKLIKERSREADKSMLLGAFGSFQIKHGESALNEVFNDWFLAGLQVGQVKSKVYRCEDVIITIALKNRPSSLRPSSLCGSTPEN